jgi:hypothetical protein
VPEAATRYWNGPPGTAVGRGCRAPRSAIAIACSRFVPQQYAVPLRSAHAWSIPRASETSEIGVKSVFVLVLALPGDPNRVSAFTRTQTRPGTGGLITAEVLDVEGSTRTLPNCWS